MYVATASPVKFPEAVALSLAPSLGQQEAESVAKTASSPLDHLKSRPVKELRMDAGQDWFKMLTQKIEEVNASWL